jgi:hypothetical protein
MVRSHKAGGETGGRRNRLAAGISSNGTKAFVPREFVCKQISDGMRCGDRLDEGILDHERRQNAVNDDHKHSMSWNETLPCWAEGRQYLYITP